MEDHRFDGLVRRCALAGGSRRGFLRGLIAALAAALAGDVGGAGASCPPGQLMAAGRRCVCRTTGRPPGPNGCTGCDPTTCRPTQACETARCVGDLCQRTPVSCPPPGACQTGPGVCDPATGLCGYGVRTGETCGAGPGCSGDSAVAQGVCDAAGVCRTPAPVPCAPFACRGGVCLTSCATAAECASGHYCDGATCRPAALRGATCDETVPCGAGLFCVDGICCDAPCPGPCHTCTAPGFVGTCRPLSGTPCEDGDRCTTGDQCQDGICRAGTATSCPQCRACDPADGQCKPAFDGASCDDGDPCTGPGTCAGGVCQTGAPIACPPPAGECLGEGVCTGEAGCVYPPRTGAPCGPASSCANDVETTRGTCDATGACRPGTTTPCAPYRCAGAVCATSCQSDLDCLPAYHCDDGVCLPDGDLGASCDEESDCADGLFCVRPDPTSAGVCCNTPCTEACHSCAEPGFIGTCVPASQGACPHPGLCVATGRCEVGVCVPDTMVDCGPCALCNPANGRCEDANAGEACPFGDGTGLDGMCCAGSCGPTCPPPRVLNASCNCVCPVPRRCGEACCAGETRCADPERGICCLQGESACPDGSCCGGCATCDLVNGGCAPITCEPCYRCDPVFGQCVYLGDGVPVDPTDPCGDVCRDGEVVARPGCGPCRECDPLSGECRAIADTLPCPDGTCCGGECCATGNCCDSGECASLCPPPYDFDPVTCGCLCRAEECCADAECGACGRCAEGRCVVTGCDECFVCDAASQTCVATSDGACTPPAGPPGSGTCCNGTCCAAEERCDGQQCIAAVGCVPPCGTCQRCDETSGTCLATSGAPCTPPGGAPESGICCGGTCCAPGTTCQGTTCVPLVCPTCQEPGPIAGQCVPLVNGTFCLGVDQLTGTCCSGVCCLLGMTCLGEVCCMSAYTCDNVCCGLCEECRFQGGSRVCVPVADGAACAYYLGRPQTCCGNVCCDAEACNAGVCGQPYPG